MTNINLTLSLIISDINVLECHKSSFWQNRNKSTWSSSMLSIRDKLYTEKHNWLDIIGWKKYRMLAVPQRVVEQVFWNLYFNLKIVTRFKNDIKMIKCLS